MSVNLRLAMVEGRGFESLHPLHTKPPDFRGFCCFCDRGGRLDPTFDAMIALADGIGVRLSALIPED
jgi:hypothetical protein